MNEIYINIFLQLGAIIVAFIAGRYGAKQEQQITYRKVFDGCYYKILCIIEKDFYSKELSGREIKDYAKQCIEIFENSEGYYYHSLENYCKRMEKETKYDNLLETWLAFCWSFDRQLTRVEKEISLPKRSFTYRVNTGQYSSVGQLLISYFSTFPIAGLFVIILLAISFLPYVVRILDHLN